MARRFTKQTAAAIDAIKYLYIRAGEAHRFVPIWVVVVDGRVIVRPWNDKPSGWHRAFGQDPSGAIRIGETEVPVRAVRLRSEVVNDAADAAYAEKYTTKANQKYLRGFATAKRKATTMELLPR